MREPDFEKAKIKHVQDEFPKRREMRFSAHSYTLMCMNAKYRGLSVAAYTRYLLDYALREDTGRILAAKEVDKKAAAKLAEDK